MNLKNILFFNKDQKLSFLVKILKLYCWYTYYSKVTIWSIESNQISAKEKQSLQIYRKMRYWSLMLTFLSPRYSKNFRQNKLNLTEVERSVLSTVQTKNRT